MSFFSPVFSFTLVGSLFAAGTVSVTNAAAVPNGKIIGEIKAWMQDGATSEERALALIEEMTLEEKIVMLHGAPTDKVGYVGYVPGNERLGIPALRLNDGPQGYRDNDYPGTSTAWPSALTVSATWDADLLQRWGEAMGAEFYGKGANVFLGPGLNLARVPLNGRNFEYASGEDPYVGYTLAQPIIKGVQSQGVIANAKHWVNNNQETDRSSYSASVEERTQHELYYWPFLGAIEAGVGSFMCSYNKIGGTYACENSLTLNTGLRGDLDFKGWVMSDWGATHSTSIKEGLDQEMPGSDYFNEETLKSMLDSGSLTETTIDESLKRIFTPMFEIGLFDAVNDNTHDMDVTSVENTALARELSADSHVLLKNEDGALPLSVTEGPLKILLVGHAARNPIISGGGSGRVVPKTQISPYDGIMSALGITDKHPVKVDCSIKVEFNKSIEQYGCASATADSLNDCAALCGSTTFCNYYVYRMDDKWCGMYPTNYQTVDSAEPGQMLGYCSKEEPEPVWQCNEQEICVAVINGDDRIATALLTREADVALVFLASFAREGSDRESLSFDADMGGQCQLAAPAQDTLVDVVSGTGTVTIVVAAAPGAMLTPWRDQVDAILYSGMPGQEYGNALADVLFGVVNPSGKLTITMPKMENEVGFTPEQYPGTNLEAKYSENLYIGYRYYSLYYIKPAYPFGHGLSYTTFSYADIVSDSSAVSCTVTNSGLVAGREVAQLYLTFPVTDPDDHDTPPEQLRGFVKTALLQPGESQEVVFNLSWRDLSTWDSEQHNWVEVKGQFQVQVGSSGIDLRLTDSITVW